MSGAGEEEQTQPLPTAATAPWQPQLLEATPLEVGARVGRFVVLHLLGQGGMGRVYAAYDPTLDRKIAIKLLRHQAQTGEQHQRVLREARALARLNHRGIVQIHDVGESAHGLYLATEWIDGRPLRKWQHETRPGWRAATSLMIEVGEALGHAHAQGIVHRDIKPDNVLVDAAGSAHLIDFGIAGIDAAPLPRASAEEEAPGPGMTQTAYTPQYAAPEQIAGEDASAAADQFSFCATWYELVVGRGLREPHRREAAVVPDRAALAALPPRLRELLLRGLAIDPAQRHADLAVLVAAMRAALAPPRRTILLGLAVAAVAAVAAAWTLRAPAPCADGEDAFGATLAAVTPRVRASFASSRLPFASVAADEVLQRLADYGQDLHAQRSAVCRATHVQRTQSPALADLRNACLDRRHAEAAQLLAMFAEADAGLVGRSAQVLDGLSDSASCTTSQSMLERPALPVDARLRALVAHHGDELAAARAEMLAARVDAAAKRVAAVPAAALEYPPLAAEAALLDARIREERGEYEPASARYREAYVLALTARDALASVAAAARAAAVIGERLKQAEAAAWWRGLARAEMVRSGESMPLRELEVLFSEGRLALQAGRYEEYRGIAQAARGRIDALGEAAPVFESLQVESMLGNAALALGDYAEARRVYERLLPRAEAALGAEHPRLSQLRSNYAQILQYLGEFAAGIRESERALAIALANYGEQHATSHAALLTLAIALDSANRDAEAVPAYERALASGRAAFGENHPDLVYVLNGIAQSLIELQRHAEAARYTHQALALIDRAELPDDLRVETLIGHARALRPVDAAASRRAAADARARLGRVENAEARTRYREQIDAIASD
ncbi:MAG: serine/threonine protein kinase [Xanthomonadales bacterium]|nr:serine/threonine protein kinase [Xanthomonadales bacterium]